MGNISFFPNEVIEELKYYVYRLIDPRNGETFYVGKGKGNRVFSHIELANSMDKFDELNDKLQNIREIHLSGLEVIHIIHRHGMDEEIAFAVEAALIDAYPSAKNIVGGKYSNEYGPMNSKEIIRKYKAEVAEISHKVIIININASGLERKIYEATRYAWKLNKSRAEKAEYVFAVSNGIIREVFKPTKWLKATKANFPNLNVDTENRYGFEGNKAECEIRQLYVGRILPSEYRKKGAANPIKYSY